MGGSCASTCAKASKYRARSGSSWGGVDPCVDHLVADRAVSIGRSIQGGQVPHACALRRPLIWRGVCPWDKSAITRRRSIPSQFQQALLRVTPGCVGGFASFLGPKLPVRVRMVGDLVAHHRRAVSNQMSDTHLGQTRLQSRLDRRAILDPKHPTTPHDQPPNSIIAT